MKNWKEKVHFVLVEPVESGNIGASARAIKNMGFKNLSLVRPPEKLGEEADIFAHNAMDVLRAAATHPTLAEALADKALVIGTSRVRGKRRSLILGMDEAAQRVFSTASRNGRVAVLFGREDSGLSSAEMDECAFMLNIPTDSRQPSLNLAQAVMVVAYELGRRQMDTPASGDKRPLSTHSEQNLLSDRITQVLELLGYTKRGERKIARRVLVTVKRFLGRAGLTRDELKMLADICTRLVKRLER